MPSSSSTQLTGGRVPQNPHFHNCSDAAGPGPPMSITFGLSSNVGSTAGGIIRARRPSGCVSRVSWPACFPAIDLQVSLSTGQFDFFPA